MGKTTRLFFRRHGNCWLAEEFDLVVTRLVPFSAAPTNSPELVNAAFNAGTSAYVLKEDAGEELIGAVHASFQGKGFVSSGIHSDRAFLY